MTLLHKPDPASPPRRAGDFELGTARARYALLIAALLVAATHAGNLVFYHFLGPTYGNALKSCIARYENLPPLEAASRFSACTDPADIALALFSLGIGLVVAVLGWSLPRRLPLRLYRRSGRIRAAARHWQDEAEAAVRGMGGKVMPVVEFASASREAFTVKVEGRVRIVLPNGILRLPRDEAVALLRHECAHVAAGDVGRVWLTRSIWWATAAVLVLPLMMDLGRLMLSVRRWDQLLSGFNRDYVIRSAAVLCVVWFISRSVLRSREHYADLVSSSGPSSTVFRPALSSLLGRGQQGDVPRWRALASTHPSPRRRLDVLRDGTVGRQTRAVEGFAFGAVAGMVQPAVAYYLQLLVPPTSDQRGIALAIGAVPGVLLGFAWGTTVWRSHSADGARSWTGRAASACGLPLGIVVGLALSAISTGQAWVGTTDLWSWGVSAVGPVGATALCRGVSALWSHHRVVMTPWWAGMFAALLFTGAVELIYALRTAVSVGAGDQAWLVLTTQLWWALLAGQVGVAVVAWRIATGARVKLLALTVALSLTVALPRLLLGSEITVDTAMDHLLLDLKLSMAAGLAAFVICALAGGTRGTAWGVAAAWSTALLTAAVLTLKFNHPLEIAQHYVLLTAGSLAPALLVLSALAIVLPLRRGERGPATSTPD